jgi:hypothetical protein
MINTTVGAGAGAASHYGSGSDHKMRLLAAPCGSGSTTLAITPLLGLTSKYLNNAIHGKKNFMNIQEYIHEDAN